MLNQLFRCMDYVEERRELVLYAVTMTLGFWEYTYRRVPVLLPWALALVVLETVGLLLFYRLVRNRLVERIADLREKELQCFKLKWNHRELITAAIIGASFVPVVAIFDWALAPYFLPDPMGMFATLVVCISYGGFLAALYGCTKYDEFRRLRGFGTVAVPFAQLFCFMISIPFLK